MSTEEMVVEIQQGNTALLTALWESVRRLVYKFANRYYAATEGRGGVTVEDLEQTGFLALMDAIPRYDPKEAAFSTFLVQYLRKHFQKASGRIYLDAQGRKMPKDALDASMSLNVPVDEEEETELLDLLEDPAASCDRVEERIWFGQLHDTVEDVLRELPGEQRDVLHHRYWLEQSYEEVGGNLEITGATARQIEGKAIQELRRGRNIARLRPFHDFDYYGGSGLAAFRGSGLSIQERYVMKKEGRNMK